MLCLARGLIHASLFVFPKTLAGSQEWLLLGIFVHLLQGLSLLALGSRNLSVEGFWELELHQMMSVGAQSTKLCGCVDAAVGPAILAHLGTVVLKRAHDGLKQSCGITNLIFNHGFCLCLFELGLQICFSLIDLLYSCVGLRLALFDVGDHFVGLFENREQFYVFKILWRNLFLLILDPFAHVRK
jgi:hypothetical protein